MDRLSEQPDSNINILSLVPVVVILLVWCLLSIDPSADVHAIQIVETVIIALLISISAYSLGDGSRNFGIAGMIIGLALNSIPLYLLSILPEPVLLEPSTQSIIILLFNASNGITLFSTVVLGLWMSTSIPLQSQRLSKYGAFVLAISVTISWLTFVLVNYYTLGYYPLGLPSIEIFFMIILILTSSLFVPRRQGLDLFYFILGIVLVYWGAVTLMTAPNSYYEIVGHIYRVISTILVALFAFPLGARKLRESSHPEHTIFIALPLWFFVEIILGTMTTFPFTVPRIIMIGFVLYIALTNIKTEHGILSLIGTSIGVILTYAGLFLWHPSYLLIQSPSGPQPLVDPFASIFVSMFGLVLLLYCVVNFGAFLKERMDNDSQLTIFGTLLVIVGVIAGVSNFLLSGPFYLLDSLYILFVVLGTMFVNLKPTQSMRVLSILGFVTAFAILSSGLFTILQLLYYPSLAAMIFFGVQFVGTKSNLHLEGIEEE